MIEDAKLIIKAIEMLNVITNTQLTAESEIDEGHNEIKKLGAHIQEFESKLSNVKILKYNQNDLNEQSLTEIAASLQDIIDTLEKIETLLHAAVERYNLLAKKKSTPQKNKKGDSLA